MVINNIKKNIVNKPINKNKNNKKKIKKFYFNTMSSMSTPISQIRNAGGGNMSQQSIGQDMPLQMPIYNPNPPIIDNSQQMSQMPQQTQSNLVDELLTELEAQPDYQQDTNVAQSQYAMDPVNVPQTLEERNKHMLQSENTHSVTSNSNSIQEGMIDEAYMFGNVNKMENKSSMMDTIITEGKPVLIVFLLFVILSLHQVNRIIFSFVPQLLLDNGQLSLYAILLKALLASILYFGLMKLI